MPRTRRGRSAVVAVRTARFDAGSNSVLLTLGRSLAGRPRVLTITGLGGAGASAAPIVTVL